MQIGENLMNRR